jgi:hypothetical protein
VLAGGLDRGAGGRRSKKITFRLTISLTAPAVVTTDLSRFFEIRRDRLPRASRKRARKVDEKRDRFRRLAVVRLKDGTVFRTSYDDMIEDLAWRGIGPLAHDHGPRRSMFAKSHPLPTSRGGFDQCVHDCAEIIASNRRWNVAAQARRERRRRHEDMTAKAFADLDAMVKALPPPAVAVKTEPSRAAEVVAKAITMFNTDSSLNASQRGELLISLGRLVDGVAEFRKAEAPVHPYVARIEQVQSLLKRALAEKRVGQAEPLIRKLLADIDKGDFDHGDHVRLELLLAEIKRELMKETDNGEEA